MIKIIEENKDSIFTSLRFEFDIIQNGDRLVEIYNTTKILGMDEEAEEMYSDLIQEGIINKHNK